VHYRGGHDRITNATTTFDSFVKARLVLTLAQFIRTHSIPPSIVESVGGGIAWLLNVMRHGRPKEDE
jgi:hypothetical protein